jgi:hypothetical protein
MSKNISAEAAAVLKAIKTQTPLPDDMPDHVIWKAEDELLRQGLVYREDGDLVAYLTEEEMAQQ